MSAPAAATATATATAAAAAGWFSPFFGDRQLPAEDLAYFTSVGVISAITFLVFFLTIFLMIIYMSLTLATPSPPKGWYNVPDYDAAKGARRSIADYMASTTPPLDPTTTPMMKFTIATANFGGVFTEDIGAISPYIGTVSPDAARRQVEAGARAIVLDVWPSPVDQKTPIVDCMTDVTQWSSQSWWQTHGLAAGNGTTYSNWRRLTRGDPTPVSTIVTAAVGEAFDSANPQNNDPFFLILHLHGAMPTGYLNTLGNSLITAIGTHRMSPTIIPTSGIATVPVQEFLGKCCVIVCPDIQTNSLPGVSSYPAFLEQFATTVMAEVASAVEQGPSQMMFSPADTGSAAAASQKGFAVIQPTVGGRSTRNSSLFITPYTTCMTSAQFVAVNLFSPDSSASDALTQYFSPAYFETYSFVKRTP
jgi:hypothetical protein